MKLPTMPTFIRHISRAFYTTKHRISTRLTHLSQKTVFKSLGAAVQRLALKLTRFCDQIMEQRKKAMGNIPDGTLRSKVADRIPPSATKEERRLLNLTDRLLDYIEENGDSVPSRGALDRLRERGGLAEGVGVQPQKPRHCQP
jgi:hypothetical protein